MKRMKHLLRGLLVMGLLCVLPVSAQAADDTFRTGAPADYYGSTSYEEVYGSQYNYGGLNAADFQTVDLPYGSSSMTQAGVMEKSPIPGLQANSAVGGVFYGLQGGGAAAAPAGDAGVTYPDYKPTAFTSTAGMERADGSIGTIKIPALGISVKVWEGETSASMAKGVGHYSSTSGWDGNVGVCGHNRGATYVIGAIKDLKAGDTITYTTVYGTRTYQVVLVKTISSTDWSYLQPTADNRITLTTCLANHPESRVCVQAVEVG